MMRIAKYISNSGYCSRREAEKLIIAKKVFINKTLCELPSRNVSKHDEISINGKIIKLDNRIRLWKLYKPKYVMCTNNDPQKRKTIFSLLPKKMPRLISIGRLDYMTEGLLLLTNNGDFARKLELPKSNILRVYRVYLKGIINNNIEKINSGISINGILYTRIEAKIEKINKKHCILIFKLREGKNREIRNICKYFKWTIIKLIRLQYGPIKLSKDRPGEIKEIKEIPNELI